MLIVRIDGGLGNQMFIYSFARLLANKGYEVKLDASWYIDKNNTKPFKDGIAQNTIRNLEITNYSLTLPILLDFDVEQFFKSNDNMFLIRKTINKLIPKPFRRTLYKFNVDDDLKLISKMKETKPFFMDNSYFSGFFQSLTYINAISKCIYDEFKTKSNLTKYSMSIKQKIIDTKQSIFLHIRRGDYLLLSDRGYIQLTHVYYNQALDIICKNLTNPHIFVFSNDMQWCKNEFIKTLNQDIVKKIEFEFIDNNDEGNAFCDMELMRSCKHAIIANSTFSWWAAYLINNPQKIVIAPSKVFKTSSIERMRDFYPKEWILVDI